MRSAVVLPALLLAASAGPAAASPSAHQVGKLVAPQRMPGDRFGTAVAAEGALGLVGASLATVNLATQAGRIFALGGTDWATVADIDATPGATTARQLGTSAAISGTLAAFGAPIYLYNNQYYSGGIYVYTAIAETTWQLETVLPAQMPVTDKYVGISVALAGDLLLAGTLLDQPAVPGRAYAWKRTNPGEWTAVQSLSAPDPAPGDRFGLSLAISGTRALIGAPGSDEGRGAAYVFEWTGTQWDAGAKLVAADRMIGDGFGFSVALDGDVALVGAPGREGNAGTANIFALEGEEWVEQLPALVPADRENGSQHGRSVALRLPYAVVTAIDHALDVNNPMPGGAGRAVWYGRDGDGSWIELATIMAEDGIPGDRLGWSASISGDHTLVGAPGDDTDLGAVYVFRLELPEGAACVAATDCSSMNCCGGMCMAACVEPTSSGPDSTSTGGTGPVTSADPPGLDIDPAEAVGCACTSGPVPGDSLFAGLAVLLLAAARRRRPGSARPPRV